MNNGESERLLELRDVSIQFGGLTAVQDFSVVVDRGELVGLIGPNGAGKTTIFNMITGVYRPTRGEIRFRGHPIVGQRPYQISHRGIARTFQNIRLFGGLTVLDNVRIGAHNRVPYRLPAAVLRTRSFGEAEREMERSARELLQILRLESRADELAGSLSYGDQRRLEICRALASRPDLLLLDEPAAGMNPAEAYALMDSIRGIRDDFHLAILLIEHNMEVVMGACERILVLNYGKKIAAGSPQEIRSDPAVIAAYLGEPTDKVMGAEL